MGQGSGILLRNMGGRGIERHGERLVVYLDE
jgi:hypothetical protein